MNQVYEKEEGTTPTRQQQQTHVDPHPCSKPKTICHYSKEETNKKLAKYLHAACFPLVKSTWEWAIENKKIISWPGLLMSLIQQHLLPSTATVQGNLHKQQKNLQSAK